MKYDNQDINQAVHNALYKYYGLSISSISHIPVGEESIAYKIVSTKGEQYFVKFCNKPNILKTIDTVNSLLLELSKYDFIIPPVAVEGVTSFPVLDGRIYVYPFIDGGILTFGNEKFDRTLVGQITEIMATIHLLIKNEKIKTNLSTENFEERIKDGYIRLNKLFSDSKDIDQLVDRSWNKGKNKLWKLIDNHSEQGMRYQQHPPEMTITHGDITGRNIIVTKDGLKLVDWDGVKITPVEKDLNFFLDNPNFSVEKYLHLTNKKNYDSVVARYYGQRWALESVLDNFDKLTGNGFKQEDQDEYFSEIEQYMNSSSFSDRYFTKIKVSK